MKHNLLKSVILSVILFMGVSNAWGQTLYLIGEPVNTWTYNNTNNYPINNYYGQDKKNCIYVWMETGQTFALHNAYNQYGPETNLKEIANGSGDGIGNYENGKLNAWKYTGKTGLVRICIDQTYYSNEERNEWRPWVWVEELTNVLKGTEVMFYYGDTWGWGDKYIRSANSTSNSDLKFLGKADFEKLDSKKTYSTCCKVSTGRYWISNNSTWEGVQMSANAEGGAMYSLTDGNTINVISGVKPTWSSNLTTFKIFKGNKSSGIAATCDNNGNSVINKPNTIYYCYTQDNQNYHRFDPNDVSNLPLGTYTVWAIACDGHIAVRSATSVELQIKNCTVNYMESPGGKVTVTYGNSQTQTLTPNQPLDIAPGSVLKFSVEANDGYTFKNIYIRNDKNNYTTISNGGTITISNDVIVIPEFTSNTENKTIFLDLSRPIPNDGRTWTSENSPLFLMYDGSSNKTLTTFETNLYYYAAQQFPVGKVVIFKRVKPSDTSEVWNECATIVPATPTNMFVITGWTQSGVWEAGPTCIIELGYTNIGRYGIKFNNDIYYEDNKNKLDLFIEVPYGSKVEVLEGEPGDDAYKTNIVMEKKSNKEKTYFDFSSDPEKKYVTITEDVKFDDLFATKGGTVIYIGVPKNNNNLSKWYSCDDNAHTLGHDVFLWQTKYPYDYPKTRVQEMKKKTEKIETKYYTYYKFIIDEDVDEFDFQFKRIIDNEGKWDNDPAHAGTKKSYCPPISSTSCYILDGNLNGEHKNGYTGTWGLPIVPITIDKFMYGKYGFKYNGKTYLNLEAEDVEFNEVPLDATVEIIDVIHTSPEYIDNPRYPISVITQPTISPGIEEIKNKDYKIVGQTCFAANSSTKQRLAYLHIPADLIDDWKKNDENGVEYANCAYVKDYLSGNRIEPWGALPVCTLDQELSSLGLGEFWCCTIPEGFHTFTFERKKKSELCQGTGRAVHSPTFLYGIPVTDVNCFTLDGEQNGTEFSGYWEKLPSLNNKYRLLYVEQVVEKDKENNTVITRKKAHPSDIFTKEDITTYTKDDGSTFDGKLLSLHVYRDRPYTGICWYDEDGHNHKTYNTRTSNAGVILQKTVGGKWVDVSHHMVFGPLEAVPEVALLPGRKNAASSYSSENITNLYYDDGIEPIKNDDHTDKGNGVWNFVVKKNNQGEVYIALDETHRYEGDYYIRTLATTLDGWDNYTSHTMTRSDISKVHSNYSHYFCKWIEQVGTNVQFTVANKYGCAISDTLMSDRTDLWDKTINESSKIVRGLTLPKEASVRFSWNEKTNFIHRAYLGGSTHVYERFLVLTGSGDNNLFGLDGQQLPEGKDNPANPDPRYGLNVNEEIFNDVSNWVYYADVNMKPRAQVKLTADIQWQEGTENIEVVQHFIGSSDAYCDTVLKGNGSQQYHVRMLYDFKTNEIISAYVPGGNQTIEPIETNLMLVRQENNPASQMTFTNNDMQDEGKRSYGVLELTRSSLIDNYTDDDYYRVSLYWISFPFDVAIKDIFGFGTYGKHWLIQSYNGQKRADNGLWADSDTNWEYHSNPNSLNAGTQYEGIMKKGVGYVVALNRNRIISDKLFEGRISTIALYFPANTTIKNHIVNGQTEIIEVPAHECTIKRPTPQGDRTIRDSHWNVIGVPSYADPISSLLHYYRWDGQYDAYTLMSSANGDAFKIETMNAYMVQYKGNLNWSNVVEERSAIAAKRNTDDNKKHQLRLELQQNGETKDYTYVTMQDEDVTTGFDFNYDLCKIINKGSNIYSIITNEESPVEVAANVLPIEETIIPLGVVTTTAGEYTFAMPNGTDGIVVELIDYETNTRTNMLLDNYTVNLGKGTFENRFALHVKPDKTTTSVDNIGNEATGDKVKKYLIDGVLYMQKDGVLYDAQGRCVQ